MDRRWTVPAALAVVVCFTSGWFLQGRLSSHGNVLPEPTTGLLAAAAALLFPYRRRRGLGGR